MRLLFIVLAVGFFAKQDMAFAQAGLIQGANNPSKADLKTLNSEGRLTHIVVTPQEKTVDYYLAGTKEGEINLNNLNLFSNQVNLAPNPHPSAASAPSPVAEPDTESGTEPSTNPITTQKPHRQPIHKIVKTQVTSQPASITASHDKKSLGYSEMFYVMLLLMLLFVALYAHRTSLEGRRRQDREKWVRWQESNLRRD